MSFGGDANRTPMKYNQFLHDVKTPIVHDLFALVLQHVGPRITQYSDVRDLYGKTGHILKLHDPRNAVHECVRAAHPEGMYWLGTALFFESSFGIHVGPCCR